MKSIIQQLRRFVDDERAVSPVVGFVLIFALIMIVFTIYQAEVVPAQNEQVEYEHSQTVEGQMEQLGAAVISGDPTAAPRAVPLQLGVQYPARAFAINPGSPVGALDSTGPHIVEISGEDGSQAFNTSFINYQPNYLRMSEETQYSIEHGMMIEDYSSSDTTRLESAGALFSDDEQRVNLRLLSSDLHVRQLSTVVTTEAVDTHTINISSDSAELSLPTTLSRDGWNRTLSDTEQVTDWTYSSSSSGVGRVDIALRNGTAITVTKVSAGDPEASGEIETQPSITNVTSLSPEVFENTTTNLTVRTADPFGSALSGVDIAVSTTGGGTVTPTDTDSDGRGRATFAYTPAASDSGSTVEVTASLPNGSGGPNRSVTFELAYSTDAGDSGGPVSSAGGINASNFAGDTHPAFDVHMEPTVNISGFSITTRKNLSATTETENAHNFFIYTTPEGTLGYESSTPIQLDGTVYSFASPKPVTDSRVQIERFDWDSGIELEGFARSSDSADLVVTFVTTDDTERSVYFTAVPSGGN